MRKPIAVLLAGLLSCSSLFAAEPALLLLPSGVVVSEKNLDQRPLALATLREEARIALRDGRMQHDCSAVASGEQELDGATSRMVRSHCRRSRRSCLGRGFMQRWLLPHRCQRCSDGRIVVRSRRGCVDRLGSRPGQVGIRGSLIGRSTCTAGHASHPTLRIPRGERAPHRRRSCLKTYGDRAHNDSDHLLHPFVCARGERVRHRRSGRYSRLRSS